MSIRMNCLCGKATDSVTIPSKNLPIAAYICHCDSCRHLAGTLCLTVAFLPDKFYRPSQERMDQLSSFVFSPRITCYFCKDCGTRILLCARHNSDDQPATVVWGIPTGTLEKAEGIIKILGHEHIADTLDGGFSDFFQTIHGERVERWPHHFQQEEELPSYWRSSEPAVNEDPRTERLQVRCKCGGIEFWVSRPSERSASVKAPWPDVLIPFHSGEPKPSEQAWWLRDQGKKYLAGVCACDSCRLASGMEWVEWAFVPTASISLDSNGEEQFTRDFGTLKHYRSSKEVTRHFCGTCGAMVFWDGDFRTELIDVAVGLFHAPEGARAENWLEWY